MRTLVNITVFTKMMMKFIGINGLTKEKTKSFLISLLHFYRST